MKTTNAEFEEKRQSIMDRIDASRKRLVTEMSEEERELVRSMPMWQMEYCDYHQTLIDAGFTNG